jgi:DNA polymerase V
VAAMLMWVATDPFREKDPQYENSTSFHLPEPTNYTPHLVKVGNRAIDHLYKPGFKYKRVGVLYTEMAPAGETQQNLFWQPNVPRQNALMAAMDKINDKLESCIILNSILLETKGPGQHSTLSNLI